MKWLEKQLILKIEKDNKNYIITCPKLKGSFGAGETLEKALLKFSYALTLHMIKMVQHSEKIDVYSYKKDYVKKPRKLLTEEEKKQRHSENYRKWYKKIDKKKYKVRKRLERRKRLIIYQPINKCKESK